MRSTVAAALALVILSTPHVAAAEDAATSAEVARLSELVRSHEAELQKLREEKSRFRVSGYVQNEWVPFRQSSEDEVDPSTGQPLNLQRFLIRRARMRLEAERGYVIGSFELDANTLHGIQVRPFNAEATIRWPAGDPGEGPFVAATMGLFLTPFGYEAAEADGLRPFLERTTAIQAFFPSSADLGFRLRGGYRFVTYSLGIMNGEPIGESTFPGVDPNESKDVVGRIQAHGSFGPRVKVAAGVSGLSGQGFHAGTRPTKDALLWRDVNEDGVVQTTEVQVIAGSAGTPSENFKRFALGADLQVHVDVPILGEFAARAEIVRASNLDRGYVNSDPVAAGRDYRQLGWQLGFVQELTKWGLVGFRYDVYDPDFDASEQKALRVVPVDRTHTTTSVLAAVRYEKAKLVGQFDHSDNHLGRGTNGLPARLADDTFTLRVHVGF
ncbi:MAG: hypothetical protein U0169_01055 [Polyangiaceae bacterium]